MGISHWTKTPKLFGNQSNQCSWLGFHIGSTKSGICHWTGKGKLLGNQSNHCSFLGFPLIFPTNPKLFGNQSNKSYWLEFPTGFTSPGFHIGLRLPNLLGNHSNQCSWLGFHIGSTSLGFAIGLGKGSYWVIKVTIALFWDFLQVSHQD